MMKLTLSSFVVLFSVFSLHTSIASEELPLWEVGVGVGGLSQSYYTGTKQKRRFAFPVIVPVYRGEIIKSDDKGMRAELFNNNKLKLEASLDFNLSTDSDEIELRQGMDDIPNNLQLGPSIEFKLAEDKKQKWLLNFPVRANIGFNSSNADINGYTFSPNIAYIKKFNINKGKWRLGFSVGPQFGSSEYHDVYYGVPEKSATSNRPMYASSGGYTGYRASSSLVSKNNKRLLVLFLRYENIDNAVFKDSPLIETNDNLIAGFVYNHYLFKSDTKASKH